jgi:flagellar basal-body rod protein FlgB
MDHNLTLLRLASSLAAHATARQGLVAENIANADTPGYRARDVAEFDAALEEGPGFAARATRAGHMSLAEGDPRFEARETAAFGAETPNGNSVSLEDQMIRGAEVRQSHDLALGVYRKTMDILRTSIGKG